jgi:hypothetical protein
MARRVFITVSHRVSRCSGLPSDKRVRAYCDSSVLQARGREATLLYWGGRTICSHRVTSRIITITFTWRIVCDARCTLVWHGARVCLARSRNPHHRTG